MASPTDGDGARGDGPSREERRLAGRAGVVAAGTLVSRVLGLGREVVMAAVFPRLLTDAFMVAFTIPNLLRQLLAEGAVQTAALPVLSQVKEREGSERARELFRSLRGLSWLVLLLVTLAGVVLAPALVDLFAPGFAEVPGQRERCITTLRFTFPYIFFMGTAALGAAALNVHGRFVATSVAPGLLNVAMIACSFGFPAWLAARGHDPVLALAFGALLGGALQVVAQWPSLRAIGYLVRPAFRLGDPAVREILARLGPVLLGVGVYAVDVVAARSLLSHEGVGAQSWFGWAMRLCDFPQGIFVMALSTATLPSLATLAARGEQEALARTFAFGARLALFVAVPASALLVVLAEPLVVALFERGAFDAVSSLETARALAAQGVGVAFVALSRQLVGVFYALGDTRTPVVVAALDFGAFLGLALLLRGPLGHVGIGLAVAGASAVQALLLGWRARRRLAFPVAGEVIRSALRTVLAVSPACLLGRLAADGARQGLGAGPWANLVVAAVGVLAFAVTFLIAAWALRAPELALLRRGARR